MFKFFLKSIVVAFVMGILLTVALLFANTQRLPSTRPHKIIRGTTPRRTIKRPPLTKDRAAEIPFQENEFYRTIIDNNLFRPLGWKPERQKEPFRLIGTRIPSDAKTSPKKSGRLPSYFSRGRNVRSYCESPILT